MARSYSMFLLVSKIPTCLNSDESTAKWREACQEVVPRNLRVPWRLECLIQTFDRRLGWSKAQNTRGSTSSIKQSGCVPLSEFVHPRLRVPFKYDHFEIKLSLTIHPAKTEFSWFMIHTVFIRYPSWLLRFFQIDPEAVQEPFHWRKLVGFDPVVHSTEFRYGREEEFMDWTLDTSVDYGSLGWQIFIRNSRIVFIVYFLKQNTVIV